MNRRYGIGILLVAAASTLTFSTSIHLFRLENHRAEALSVVANQRVLSQRIAFLVAALDEESGPSPLSGELENAARLMRTGHERLTLRRDDDEISRFVGPIQGVYFSGYLPFDATVTRFTEDARAIAALTPGSPAFEAAAAKRASIVQAGTNSVMQTHDLMVRIMARQAEGAVRRGQLIEAGLWILVLLLLYAATFVIWRPMTRRIERSISDLEHAEAKAVRAASVADAASAAKGQFLEAASHELKTPLNAILGFADVLRDTGGGDPVPLEQMQLAGEHLAGLVDSILDAHRAEEGTIVLTEETYSPKAVLDGVARVARSMAERKGLSFEADLGVADDLCAAGDAARLRQICLNLLDNAVKFTDRGGVRIEADVVDRAAPKLRVMVSDTGCGIEETRAEAVFDRFSAAGMMQGRQAGGLGLGLSLSRYLAELMGGTVELNSAPGEGTEVTVRLPLHVVEAMAEENIAMSGLAPRVLVVDDNLPNRMVAEALVKMAGGEAVLCADGHAAVEAAAIDRFDLILMDISMPVMDGIEATAQIRRGGPNLKTPILAVTAHAAREDRAALLARGFQDVLLKPVRKEIVAEAVGRWAGAVVGEQRRIA